MNDARAGHRAAIKASTAVTVTGKINEGMGVVDLNRSSGITSAGQRWPRMRARQICEQNQVAVAMSSFRTRFAKCC